MDFCSSFINIGILPLGALVDLLGPHRGAVSLAVLWGVGWAVSGVAAGDGHWWVVGQCLAGSASLSLMITFQLFHAEKVAEGDPSAAATVRATISSAIEVGVIVSLQASRLSNRLG
jgi:hypothetical protein